jgi:hypothetical protein
MVEVFTKIKESEQKVTDETQEERGNSCNKSSLFSSLTGNMELKKI